MLNILVLRAAFLLAGGSGDEFEFEFLMFQIAIAGNGKSVEGLAPPTPTPFPPIVTPEPWSATPWHPDTSLPHENQVERLVAGSPPTCRCDSTLARLFTAPYFLVRLPRSYALFEQRNYGLRQDDLQIVLVITNQNGSS